VRSWFCLSEIWRSEICQSEIWRLRREHQRCGSGVSMPQKQDAGKQTDGDMPAQPPEIMLHHHFASG